MNHDELLPDDLLTVPEAARLLRCHQATVLRWILKKRLTAYRTGRRWKVSRRALLAKVERSGPAPRDEPEVRSRRELEREQERALAALAAIR